MHLNLHLLRIFYEVIEQQSFSLAAQQLHISQSAVSKGIRELENQLDLALIDRSVKTTKKNKLVQLTANGQALFEHARSIFTLERMAVDDLRARLGLKKGQLTIGASTTVGGYWLADYLQAFTKQYPDIELHIKIANTQAMSHALIDGEIDLAVVEGLVDDPAIQRQFWRDDELQIVAHPSNPCVQKNTFNKQLLSKQTWLIRETGSGTHDVAEEMLAKLGIDPEKTIELGSNEGIAQAVAAGLGVALLPTQVVQELLLLNRVKGVASAHSVTLIRPLYLLTLKNRPASRLINAFCDVLFKQAI